MANPECRLLNDSFGFFVQIILGIFAILSLYLKRHYERPQRRFITWFRDAFKQGFASLVAHTVNIILAYKLSNIASENECKWYFINYVIDNVLGLLLNYIMFTLFGIIAKHQGWPYESGEYGPESRAWYVWSLQLLLWIIIVIQNKLILFFFIIIPFRAILYSIGNFLISSLDRWPRIELVFVMIVVPLTLNIGQMWIQDNFLMHKITKRIDIEYDDDNEDDEFDPLLE